MEVVHDVALALRATRQGSLADKHIIELESLNPAFETLREHVRQYDVELTAARLVDRLVSAVVDTASDEVIHRLRRVIELYDELRASGVENPDDRVLTINPYDPVAVEAEIERLRAA